MNNNHKNPSAIFQHYLQQLKTIVHKIDIHQQGNPQILKNSLHPDMLPLLAQLRTAANFSLRCCCPLSGRERITFDNKDETFAGIQLQLDQTIQYLQSLPLNDVASTANLIEDRAGFIQLQLPAEEYVYHYALPNFFFHLNMAYAIGRAAGVPLGKGDFDGYHQYPDGFSFVSQENQ